MRRKITGLALIFTMAFCTVGCGADENKVNKTELFEKVEEMPTKETEGNDSLKEEKPSAETINEETSDESGENLMAAPEDIILGDERNDVYLPMLEGKRVALFSNHTGLCGISGVHVLDHLLEDDVNVTAIFSPEHGFRGDADAGAAVSDDVDAVTGIPILSLYGNGNYPSDEAMNEFDTLVVDIQDVGLRYYTYYVTMYYLMEACAGAGKEVIVFDRPNPNGFYVDGGILKDGFKSGVGLLPIPTVHGMTLGELAQMINGEGWLKTGANSCKLTVIPCLNYTRDMKYKLPVNPSPNLKNMHAIYLYASTCYFENTVVSVGRGTDSPFEIYGSPYLETYSFAFTPQSMAGAKNPPFEGQTCLGVDLRDLDDEYIFEAGIDLTYLISAYNEVSKLHPDVDFFGTPDKNGHYWIDLLSGSDELRNMIVSGKTAAEIKASWQAGIEEFKEKRKPYLLYD